MLLPPQPTEPTAPYAGLNLASFLEKVLKAYPDVENVVDKLCTDPTMSVAFHYYMVTEHFAGMQIFQRGKCYYITRNSSIRNTSSYELYSWVLWSENPAGNVDENPKVAYRLYSEKWHSWVAVPHDSN